MVTFRVGLISRWDAATGEVVQIPGGTVPLENVETNDDDGDAMSE